MGIRSFVYDKFGFGKNPHRLVACRLTTEDGRVIQRDLPAENGYVIWNDCSMAFLLDHAGEIPLRGSNKYELILDERDAYPWVSGKVDKDKRKNWAESINTISANEYARQFGEAEAAISKDKKNMIILLTFVVIAIVLTLMILLMYFYSHFFV